MNKAQYLLVCLAEECVEVAQGVAKALRFSVDDVESGQDLTNGDRIVKELIDVLAIVELLIADEIIEDPKKYREAIETKKSKVLKWMEHSRKMGCLKPCYHEINLLEQ